MKNYGELKWYVLKHSFNKDEIERYNIFNNAEVHNDIEVALKKYDTFEEFKNKLSSVFKCAYWYKSEYEIIASGLMENDKEYKIDIWFQIEPNLDLIAGYIIETYNKKKRKKIVI